MAVFPGKYYGVVFAFFMSGGMSLLVTLVATLMSQGIASSFFSVWMSSWAAAYPIAFPVTILVVLSLAGSRPSLSFRIDNRQDYKYPLLLGGNHLIQKERLLIEKNERRLVLHPARKYLGI